MNLGVLLRREWVRGTALVSALVLCAWAFDRRECALTYQSADQSSLFVPLDAESSFYGSAYAHSVIDNLTQAGRYWYGVSELTLDLLFPVLYAIAFFWLLGKIFPRDHKLRTTALSLPVAAAVFDVLENILIAAMAFWPASIDVLGGIAGIVGPVKHILIYASALVAILAFVTIRRRTAGRLVQYLYFARVPLIFGAIILFLAYFGRQQSCEHPAAEALGLPTVQNLVALNSGVKIVYGSLSLFLACAVVIFCGTHVWRLANARFGLGGQMGLAPESDDDPATRRYFILSAIALSLPILLMFPRESGWMPATLGSAIGIAAGIGLLYFVFAFRRTILREERRGETGLGLLARPIRAANARLAQTKAAPLGSRVLGPGFIKEEASGKVYRGHGLAFAIFVLLAIGYVTGYFVLNPGRAMSGILDVPPLAYVLLLVAFICNALTFVTFVFDRLRVPILVLIVGWLTFWGLFPAPFYDTQHYFDVSFVSGGEAAPPTIAEAFTARADGLVANQDLVTVVAVTGGGIQAAGWGAQVLAGLHESLGARFSDSIFFISSTSGGSVATYYFMEALREGDHRYLHNVPKAAMSSSLEATAWGLVFPDLQRFIVPFTVWDTVGRTRLDRAWAMERAWLRWRDCMFADTPPGIQQFELNPNCRGPVGATTPTRLSDWWRSARAGKLPGVVFNATIIEDGEQFLASNIDLSGMTLSGHPDQAFASDGNWTYGNFDPTLSAHYPPPPARPDQLLATNKPASLGARGGRERFVDMDAVTAARLSAAFPYVTPVARARVQDGFVNAWHIGDGGYFDNSGTVAAVRWINAVRDDLRAHPNTKAARILFIQINPFPAHEREELDEGQGWLPALIGPVQGIVSVRTSSQLARNDLELAFLENELGDCFEAVEFRPASDAQRRDPPLSWELSEADKARIREDWRANSNRVAYIESNYFGANQDIASRACGRSLGLESVDEAAGAEAGRPAGAGN